MDSTPCSPPISRRHRTRRACTYGSAADPVSFGEGGPGGTRHELAWQLARPSQGAWDPGYDRWFTNAQVLDLRRPTDIPDEDQCGVDAQGAAAGPGPDATCESISMHRVGRGRRDPHLHRLGPHRRAQHQHLGPDAVGHVHRIAATTAHPGGPEITDFLVQFTGFATVYVNDVLVTDVLPTTDEELDQIVADRDADARADAEATAALADLFVDDNATEEDRNAALMAVIGLMGLSGIAASVLAESGLSAEEVATAFATGGQDAVDELLAKQMAERAGAVEIDEYGNPIYPEDDGTYLWDDGEDVRRVVA